MTIPSGIISFPDLCQAAPSQTRTIISSGYIARTRFRNNCIAMHTCYDINHSSWHRFFNRRVTPEMLPETAVLFDDVDEELTNAVIWQLLKLREVILLHYYQGMKVNDKDEIDG